MLSLGLEEAVLQRPRISFSDHIGLVPRGKRSTFDQTKENDIFAIWPPEDAALPVRPDRMSTFVSTTDTRRASELMLDA